MMTEYIQGTAFWINGNYTDTETCGDQYASILCYRDQHGYVMFYQGDDEADLLKTIEKTLKDQIVKDASGKEFKVTDVSFYEAGDCAVDFDISIENSKKEFMNAIEKMVENTQSR